ncbi:Tetratricopeptide repeat (TPR)-like superfamily protein [Striga hermonthica]|uniref:Tetratricopeptide repeat (TPR)-like superfamily protein n=1 Tax=Striga hermonthica TaxID=68872 RepID=A0A9N7RI89_STRHE|nr:Tetratricopeptide repeat (TPR)-like superfamily protein [Striga hermonthica]
MLHRKHQPGQSTLTWDDASKLLRSAAMEPNYTTAPMLHAQAAKQGVLSDLPTATRLLTVYSRRKEFVSCLDLFGEILDKDVVFWNAMMSACVENKRFQTAVGFFEKMVRGAHGFDHTTLLVVLSVFSNLKSLGHGKIVHGLGLKSGMLSETVLSNNLVDMYAKSGDLSSAQSAFSEIECKDQISWNSIISGCFHNGRPEKSLSYFMRMVSSGSQADDTGLSCAMAACTCLQAYDFGRGIHGLGFKSGYLDSISVANSLISFYSQSRDICAGEFIFFQQMTAKNVVSWNAMIKGLFVCGENAKGFTLLREMQFVAFIQPDMTTLVTVIPYLAELMLLREGKAAHGCVIRREMMSEVSVVNALINLYSKCGNVKKAEFLFSIMPKKDSVAWNTMIFGYSQNGKSREARKLFKKMMGSYTARSLATLLAIIPSCDSQESLQFGRSIHGWSMKLGFSNHIYASNSIMHMYINCGVPSDAFALFESLLKKADITCWNTIIVGCSQKGHFREALVFLDRMRKMYSQLHPNSITLVNAISSCGNLGLPIHGKLLHGLAVKSGASTNLQVQNSLVTMYGRVGDTESAKAAFDLSSGHNLCSWNCLISAVSQNDDAKIALELFRSLEFEPDEITISTVLSACAQLGDVTYGTQIHGHVVRFNFHKNPYISSALIDMYSNCGKLDVAERVFSGSPKKSVSAWNSLISGYGFHNSSPKAVEKFQEMVRSGVRPTNGSFTSLLSACGHSGMIDDGRKYYEQMWSEFNVRPTTEHHVCMVDMLGRAGKLNEAFDFVRSLPGKSEAGVWGALLSACGYHGDLEMGRKVGEVLFRLEPENVSYYVALCNMYVGAGMWEEAVRLRAVIQEKQLKKEAGYSSVDVGVR